MKNTRIHGNKTSAEKIARLAERNEDISGFFTNTGRMMGPVQRVNVGDKGTQSADRHSLRP